MKAVAVILGASGRLGRQLTRTFATAGFDTVGVARPSGGFGQPDSTRRISADLAIAEDRARVPTTVATWAAGRRRIYIVDAVLDRTGVDAMRQSLQGVTDTVLSLRDGLVESIPETILIAASTTAVLAPGLYQTPYGLAKRRQVVTYARAGMAGTALLLPTLSHQADAAANEPRWRVKAFDQAANRLAAAATPRPGFAIRIPDLDLDLVELSGVGALPTPAANAFLRAHVHSLVTDRNSMQAHRNAAGARLGLTPSRIRRRVDHHLAPVELIRRFADRYHVTVLDDRPAARPLSTARESNA